jgi:hypothetical protein
MAADYSGIVRRVYSGTCVCGHDWTDHHLHIVQDPAIVEILGTSEDPGGCEVYGFNEDEGLDEAGAPHCFWYVDLEDPDSARHARWREQVEAARRRL